MQIIDQLNKESMRLDIPDFRAGDTVKVHAKIREGEKERIQIFEGIILGLSKASVTVRKLSHGIGVEKIFPLDLPAIEKIELVKEPRRKIRRSKITYIRKSPRAMREV